MHKLRLERVELKFAKNTPLSGVQVYLNDGKMSPKFEGTFHDRPWSSYKDLGAYLMSKVGLRVYKCPIGNQYYYGLKLYENIEGMDVAFVDEQWSKDVTENSLKIPDKHILVGVHGYITQDSHIQ